MDEVIRVKKGRTNCAKNASALNQSRVQHSATLNRRFVKKPNNASPRIRAAAGAASRTLKNQNTKRVMINKSNTVVLKPLGKRVTKQQTQAVNKKVAQQDFASRASSRVVSLKELARVKAMDDDVIAPAQESKVATAAKARLAARKQAATAKQLSAQELKDRAIQQALRRVSTMEDVSDVRTLKKQKHFWQKKKIVFAAGAAVILVAVLGYLVSVNLPNISVRVAAMHTGIDKAYPSYVPATYRLDGLVKEENGRITMAFRNEQDQRFTITEEKSSWDSAAVLSNFVAKNWGADYSITKGQGLTIYVSESAAAWVNGGVFYLIDDESKVLSSSDLHDIAVSL